MTPRGPAPSNRICAIPVSAPPRHLRRRSFNSRCAATKATHDTRVERGAASPRCGNLTTRTDARGKQTLYGYDALNRLTQVNPGDQLITLTWDSCSNGLGRLCQIIDGTANTLYQYDRAGHVTGKTVTIGSVSLVTAYAWNSSGQLTGITTPSGQSIAYAWANGRVSGVAVNGSPLIAALQYQPFGPIKRWTWGNGEVMSRSYDYAGQLRRYSLGTDPKNGLADHRTLSYDAAGRLLRSVPAYDAQWDLAYTYDGLDRLVQARLADPVTTTWAYAYDVSGNRTRHTENGSTTNYALAATSHRLTALSGAESRSFTYDATGNVTAEGPGMVHVYDASGRRVKTTVGGQVWAYGYDALGERLKKSGPSTTLFAYDEDHHVLGEYGATGKLIQETVWLGDTPVATLRLPAGASSGPASVFYVHADHLNTPRRVTRPADHKVLWQWQGEPFGNVLPNENPQGAGTFRYALRFPGQVFDPETGLSYNFFRDYDSNTGRYRQSDPIGLDGGSWSTYAYVGGNPVSRIDPKGLLGERSGTSGTQGNGSSSGSCECSDRKCQVVCAGVPGGYPLAVCTRWINECGKITRTNIGLYYWAWLLRGFNFFAVFSCDKFDQLNRDGNVPTEAPQYPPDA